jgi:hypothetical protein
MNSFKTFNDFGKGVEEIISVIPEVKEIVDSMSLDDILTITPKELTAALAEIVMNDFPYVDFRSPALSISYKEVGFKSRSVLSFGWKYINSGDGKMQYSFRISFFSRSESIKDIEEKLAKMGWEQPPEKKSFFPYKNYKKRDEKEKPSKVHHKKEAVVEKEEPVKEVATEVEAPKEEVQNNITDKF